MLWGAFIGSQIWKTSAWSLTAGIGYYQPSSLVANGDLSQGADPASASYYQYSYQLKSQQLLAEGKMAWTARRNFHPYVMLGIGPAFNYVYGYQTTVPSYLEFTPAFSSHHQTNFSYAAGVGVDLVLSPAFMFGVAYRFTDLGKANTGSGQIDTIPISNSLKQSNVYANQILAQLTYLPFI